MTQAPHRSRAQGQSSSRLCKGTVPLGSGLGSVSGRLSWEPGPRSRGPCSLVWGAQGLRPGSRAAQPGHALRPAAGPGLWASGSACQMGTPASLQGCEEKLSQTRAWNMAERHRYLYRVRVCGPREPLLVWGCPGSQAFLILWAGRAEMAGLV